jgi:hypothetical protein
LLEPDLLERAARVSSILEPLGPDALAPVLDAYQSVVIDTGDLELVLLMDWWARFDPAAALAWARDIRIGWHPAVLAAAARVWARSDPETAGATIRRSIGDERLLAAATAGFVRGWEESGRGGLEEYLAELPPGTPRGIEALARIKVARGDPERAIAWAEGLPEDGPGALRPEAIERVAEALATAHPQAAAAWIAELRGDDPSGNLALVLRLTMRWARKDGEGAMRWLRTLEPAADLPTAVQETYRTWYMNDKEAATAWLQAAELDPWLDPAVAIFALQQSARDPDLAVEWAKRLQDPERQQQALVKIGLSYSVAAPEEAPAWLARTELPGEVRERIETALQNNRMRAGTPARGAAVGAAPDPP